MANGVAPDETTVRRWLDSATRLICADGGARAALSLGQRPHVVVGDQDSLDDAQQAQLAALGCRLAVYPVAKLDGP
jgi:thiamine pyrophosphokinase